MVGSIYGRPSIKIANFGSVNKHGQHSQFVLLIGRFIEKSAPRKIGLPLKQYLSCHIQVDPILLVLSLVFVRVKSLTTIKVNVDNKLVMY